VGGHDVTVKLVWMMQADTAVTEKETLSTLQPVTERYHFISAKT